MAESHYCEKCRRTMNVDQFYRSYNLEKYPDNGLMNLCRKCLTMHVDNWDPKTFMPILKEVDVPYIPEEWDKLLQKYGADKSKVTGVTIFGRYLAKMRLKQYNAYRWKDTAFLQQLSDHKVEESMKRQGYDQQQIATALESRNNIRDLNEEEIVFDAQKIIETPMPNEVAAATGTAAQPQEDYFDPTPDPIPELTEEERLYLRLKWGKTYKPEEWIILEKMFKEMMESYDIHSAGHIDTLKMVCKTSLKANQLLDIGDIDGAQKAVKMYDALMKSGKFTAAQNKQETGEAVDCIGELVALCEKDGFIPRYYTDGPQDKVDRTLQDLQSYTRTLIMEETNLGALIEKAVKDIQEQKEKEAEMDAEAAGDDEALEAELFDEDSKKYLKDEDFAELRNMEDADEEIDDDYLFNLVSDGELK